MKRAKATNSSNGPAGTPTASLAEEFPFTPLRDPAKSSRARRRAGLLLLVALRLARVSLFFLAVGLLVYALVGPGTALWWIITAAIALLLFSPPFTTMVDELSRRAVRMRTPSGFELLARDNRPPVLWFRAFEDELLGGQERYEERIARNLKSLGPLIALGRPDEPEPQLGAARIYLSSEDWKPAVVWLMKRAGAVVFVVGRTSGLWWEIKKALDHVPRERLLFFFPRSASTDPTLGVSVLRGLVGWGRRARDEEREKRYRRFRERIKRRSSVSLPESLGESGFVCFNAEGRLESAPKFMRIQRFGLSGPAPEKFDFSDQLEPFVDRLKPRRLWLAYLIAFAIMFAGTALWVLLTLWASS